MAGLLFLTCVLSAKLLLEFEWEQPYAANCLAWFSKKSMTWLCAVK